MSGMPLMGDVMNGKWLRLWEQLKWPGALLGTIIVFALARTLGAIVEWASILSFIVALAGLLLSTTPRAHEPRPGLSALLDQAAEDMALAVGQQWLAEERLHRLQDPFPLPVRWTTADTTITDHWVNIRMQSAQDPLNVDGELTDIAQVFSAIPSRRLVILGKPGAGKTSMVIRFTLDFLEHRKPCDPVPVIFLLASWDPGRQNLHEWMSGQLAADYPALGAAAPSGHTWARELVRAGRVLPVLDGLDEIPGSLRCAAIRSLNAAFNQDSPVLLTCRTNEYRDTVATTDVLTSAAVVELRPLSLDDLTVYLPRTTRLVSDSSADEPNTKWETVLSYIRRNPGAPVARALLDVLSNPLMTSMARAAYSDTSADPGQMLEARFADQRTLEEHLLASFVPAIYSGQRAATCMPATDLRARYDSDQACEWLAMLASHLNKLGTRDLAWWQIAEAVPQRTRCALTAGVIILMMGIVVILAAGPKVGTIYALVYGLAAGVVQGAGHGQSPSYVEIRLHGTVAQFLRRFAIGMATGLAVGIACEVPPAAIIIEGLAFGGVVALHVWLDIPADLTNVSSPAAALKQDRTATLALGLSFSIPFGLSFGFAYIFTGVNIGGPDLELITGITFGLTLGLAGGIAGAVAGWLAAGRVGSLAYGIAGAITIGSAFPPTKSTIFGLVVGLMFGIVVGLLVVLPKAWGSFVFSRVWLALRGQMPWDLVTFLIDAHQRGVLRQAGGVYQFRHAMLQDYLAEHASCRYRFSDDKKGRHRLGASLLSGNPDMTEPARDRR